MSRWTRQRRVFFVEEPIRDAGDSRSRLNVHREACGVYVVQPHIAGPGAQEGLTLQGLYRDLFDEYGIRDPVSWYYSPMFVPATRGLSSSVVVYDCMDELAAFQGAPSTLVGFEDELLARADLLFTGGRSLYEHKRLRHPSAHIFASSVDTEHFRRARRPTVDPPDQCEIPHPRLGYFGVIDERMDLQLLADVARLRPSWHIVLLGPTVKIDVDSIPKRPNIHLLGQKSYDDLPRYLAGWDVALLPFALNDATRFISPTKTPEYLAGGKPVVATPIRDVVTPYGDEGLVQIARDGQQTVAAVEAIEREGPHARTARADRFLSTMSWDRTFSSIAALVERQGANARGRVALGVSL